MENIVERIKAVMATVFEIELNNVVDDVSPHTLDKWDSINHMKLVVALEKEFSILFDPEDIEIMVNIKNIKKLVLTQLN